MCFRYALDATAQILEDRYNLNFSEDFIPQYHIHGFSFNSMPIITQKYPNEFKFLKWGLIPYWTSTEDSAKSIRSKTLNARSETVFEKPSFSTAIIKKRCLIPSTGFFEFQHQDDKKIPYFIYHRQEPIFSFAGIYDAWLNNKTGKTEATFSILTCPANKLMSEIHNVKKRMPVILNRDQESQWIDNNLTKHEINDLLQPIENSTIDAIQVRESITKKDFSSKSLSYLSSKKLFAT